MLLGSGSGRPVYALNLFYLSLSVMAAGLQAVRWRHLCLVLFSASGSRGRSESIGRKQQDGCRRSDSR